MKVYIKNKLISLGGSSTVKDENDNDVFKVKGKVISPTRKKKIYDANGNLKFIVRNKWFKLFDWFTDYAFIYDENKTKIATVKYKINLKGEYYVQGFKDEIKVEGKIFSGHSKILKNGEVVGEISRNIVSLTDAFELTANDEDLPFLVALIIAIDNLEDHK